MRRPPVGPTRGFAAPPPAPETESQPAAAPARGSLPSLDEAVAFSPPLSPSPLFEPTPAAPTHFGDFTDGAAVFHLAERMARPGPDRAGTIEALAGLLEGLPDRRRARRLLRQLFELERLGDIYPLELLERLLERGELPLPRCAPGELVLNRRFLTSRLFDVESPIPIEVPLAARVRGFALAGGPTPGYCFAPGPPGRYVLEFGDAGRFDVLVLGVVRGAEWVDRIRVWVEAAPDPMV